jgi:hypothetical protein
MVVVDGSLWMCHTSSRHGSCRVVGLAIGVTLVVTAASSGAQSGSSWTVCCGRNSSRPSISGRLTRARLSSRVSRHRSARSLRTSGVRVNHVMLYPLAGRPFGRLACHRNQAALCEPLLPYDAGAAVSRRGPAPSRPARFLSPLDHAIAHRRDGRAQRIAPATHHQPSLAHAPLIQLTHCPKRAQ